MAVDTLLIERSTPWLAHLKARGYAVPDPDAGRDGIFAQRGFGEPAVFAAEDSETAFLTDRFLQWLSVRRHKAVLRSSLLRRAPSTIRGGGALSRPIDPADVSMPVRGARP